MRCCWPHSISICIAMLLMCARESRKPVLWATMSARVCALAECAAVPSCADHISADLDWLATKQGWLLPLYE
jgi:hypothetical protein